MGDGGQEPDEPHDMKDLKQGVGDIKVETYLNTGDDTRFRRRNRSAVIIVALVAVFGVIFLLASITYQNFGASCAGKSSQCAYQTVILQDRGALSSGYILTQDSISIPLGQSYIIAATVCGQHATSCADYAQGMLGVFNNSHSTTKSEPSRFQGKLLVGARIRATLIGDVPGTVQGLSSDVQPVIASTDMATWMWRIEPSRGGSFDLLLTLTPLEGDTNSPLVAGIPLRIQVDITMTFWQRVTSAFGSVRNFLLSLGGLLSALGISFATAALLRQL